MHSIDITRSAFSPDKRYSGVLHTQGSVLLDADQNEAILIDRQDEKRTITDLLVTAGSPDNGFRIGPAAGAVGYDFELAAGTFYLGGTRLDLPRAERFRLQSEWLQMRDSGLPGGPLANAWLPEAISAVPTAVPAGARSDLVWLETWDKAVTGTEDGELIETALGVESAARLRAMRKVHVFPNAGGTCTAGFDALVAALEATGRFTFNRSTRKLASNRRMRVGFVDVGGVADPCRPAARRGFLGAENETIQVRVIADDRFIWSVGNAAPLYRVALNGGTLRFLSSPRDALLRPLAGDVIEILRADAILPNGERIAERHGLFYRVLNSFDPANGNVGLDPVPVPVPNPFPNDTAREAAWRVTFATPQQGDSYLYARVWRGETIAAAPAGKAFVAGTPVPLGSTGLTVTFTGNGPVGDSWTFSARPNTPEIISPWEMLQPSPPSAPNRYIAGLGIIEWPGGAGAPSFLDCRRRVRKLENASGCCEVTVGDNQESFGDVSTIAEALSRLPANGGKICLLRGRFTETVSFAGRRNIILEGCGPLTRLRGNQAHTQPVIGIADGERITVRGITIEALDRIAVALDDTGQDDFGENLRHIALERLRIEARDAPAIYFNGGEGLSVRDCQIDLAELAAPAAAGTTDGMASAVVLFGAQMLVETSRIVGEEAGERAALPMGGVHVLGGSEDVELRRNTIARTAGTGIVLGSVTMVEKGTPPSDRPLRTRLPRATGVDWDDLAATAADPAAGNAGFIVIYLTSSDGCTVVPVVIPEVTDDDGTAYVPDADPFIVGCRIIDNDIAGMGENGIGPFTQFDLATDQQLCGVSGLEVRDNRIRGCVRREPAELAGGQLIFTARGGIVLGWAEDVVIADNLVESCAAGRNVPVCGVFAAGLSYARITGNSIHDNGLRIIDLAMTPEPGQRGGIVIRSVVPAVVPISSIWPAGVLSSAHGRIPIQTGREALIVQGNAVSTPEGRALQVMGSGAMAITGNQFASLGAAAAGAFWEKIAASMLQGSAMGGAAGGKAAIDPFLTLDPFATLMGNAVVSVVNLGISADLDKGLPMSFGFGQMFQSGGNSAAGYNALVTTGRVLFNANQTRFDGLSLPVNIVPVLVGLVSLDDVTMTDNQCDADFLTGGLDWPMVHGAVIALMGRMASNRFSEPDIGLPENSPIQQLSGVHIGSSVMMHHNFGSHCFLGIPFAPAESLIEGNRSIVQQGLCDVISKNFTGMLGAMAGGIGQTGAGRVPGNYGYIAGEPA